MRSISKIFASSARNTFLHKRKYYYIYNKLLLIIYMNTIIDNPNGITCVSIFLRKNTKFLIDMHHNCANRMAISAVFLAGKFCLRCDQVSVASCRAIDSSISASSNSCSSDASTDSSVRPNNCNVWAGISGVGASPIPCRFNK